MPQNDWRRRKDVYRTLVSAGVPAPQGFTLICREFPESLATGKNFYNAISQSRLKELAGKYPIQALMDELTLSKLVYSVKTSGVGASHTFLWPIQHPSVLTCRYSKLLLLDFTYKTNRFRMPLLSMVGRTGINLTFYSAFAFLSGEAKADDIWVLEQLRNTLVQTSYVLVTDRDLALAGPIEKVFLDCAHLFMWHIEREKISQIARKNLELWKIGGNSWEIGIMFVD